MDKPRPCGCKGCRTCLVCEENCNITPRKHCFNRENGTYVYCPYCNKAWPGWHIDSYKEHPNHEGTPIHFSGIYIELDFISSIEEQQLLEGIDNIPWDLSQSGRRKQNFGPKCNFKKRKLRLGHFNGFPAFSKFIQDRFCDVPVLRNFQTIEQCSLEYTVERGASIDPHIDDCWIWGERVVSVNLLSDSVLTMTYNDKLDHYNLDCVKAYSSVLCSNGELNDTDTTYELLHNNGVQPIVRIPMPRYSLLVMYGSARYDWEHQVLREDILNRRICLAYREFTPPYLTKKNIEAQSILKCAQNFSRFI